MKILKYALLALGGLVLVFGAVAAYVAATFDPNQYKAQIIRAVKENTQRTLKLDGRIALSFWPGIGATLGKASLSERGGDREFAAVDEARVSLKLVPLLSKQVVVDSILVKGLRVNLVKARDGKTNADDLAAPPAAPGAAGAQPGFSLDVAGVEIVDAAIHYVDQAAGSNMDLSGFNLKTGRIAPGVPTPVELSVRTQGDKPRFDLQTTLKTRLAFQPGESAAFDDMILEMKGEAAGITKLALKATGAAAVNLKSGAFMASRIAVALTGASGKDNLDIKLDAPRFAIGENKASGDKITIVAKISGTERVVNATLNVPGIEGTSEAFKSGALALDLELKKGDLAVKARVDSPLQGNVMARQFSLPQLRAGISASGPGVPGKGITGELGGTVNADLAKQNVAANLSGKVADSSFKGQVGVSEFSPLRLTFNLDIDQLDVDRYFPSPPPPAQKAPAAGQNSPEQPFDLSALKNLNATGTLRIGSLKANNVKASNVRLDLKAANGHADVNPLTANFYQGTLSSAVAINAAPATPTFSVRHNMSGISIEPFLKDLANNDTLEGRGNVTLDVTTQGNTVAALKKGLNGSAAVKLADGAIRGIDIAGSIRGAKDKLGALRGEHTQQADKAQKTDFSELTATFAVRNGVAHNGDLSMKSPLLRVGGEGDINIGESTVNYLVKASIVGTAKGQGGRDVEDLKGLTVPVRVAGALAAPSYKLDFGAMVTDSVKQTVKEQLQKQLGGSAAKADGTKKDGAASGGAVKDKLRGLFGR